MLKDSFTARLLIRLSIGLLRAICPLSIAYCGSRLLGWVPPRSILHPVARTLLDVYTTSEALFYLLVYLPRRWWRNCAVPVYLPARLTTREQRRALFLKTWESTPDPHGYVSLWFKGVPVDALRREDVKDWLSWRMFNTPVRSFAGEEEDELDEYLEYTELVLRHSFPRGRSGLSSMVVTFEPLHMMHRPLLWYLGIIGAVDLQMATCMTMYGYQFYNVPLTQQLLTLPLRPFSLFLNRRSPSTRLSYWHLEHTSTGHLPVLFIHGIGVGLQFYLSFLNEFRHRLHQEHGIGLICLEILAVSSRVTLPVLHGDEMTGEIRKILDHHGWSRCVVVSHSYGSIVTTHMLRDPDVSSRVGPLLLVDPVAFSFHSPQVPWNFLRRRPTSASEIQLQYFASMDPDVAYTLTRKFLWPDNSLWRDDVEGRPQLLDEEEVTKCTVALSGRDIIVDTNTLGRYLTRDESRDHLTKWYDQERGTRSVDGFFSDSDDNDDAEDGGGANNNNNNNYKYEDDSWKEREWSGENTLEVIYFPTRNHAEIFEDQGDRSRLLDVVWKYAGGGAVGRSLIEN